MVWYRLAADLVLIVHTSFIAFVIFGLVVVLVGWWLGWSWVRNAWFRAAHLLAIGYVIWEAWTGRACPLTEWENALRIKGGQEPYGQAGCIAHWLHRVIFFDAEPWVFTTCYTLFGLLVLATFVLAPLRLRRRVPQAGPRNEGRGLTPPAGG
jgi:hypothetical protein